MPIDYSPSDAANTLPAGEYDAVLEKVEDDTSKTSGRPMQKWTFRIFGETREMLVTDYVVLPGATFKIKQLATALGKLPEFNARRFQAEDHIGAGVKVDLSIEEGRDGYEDKNRIGKIKAAQQTQAAPPQRTLPNRPQRQPAPSPIGTGRQFKEDDIPF